MPDSDTIDQRPSTFRGGLTFNQRTIAGAVATLLSQNDRGESLLGKPILVSELTSLLLVLESIAMSNGMYLDGTLPPADIDRLQNDLWHVKAQSGVDVAVDFVKPPSSKLETLFRDAAEAAALLIQDNIENLAQQPDEPMGGEIGEFVGAIRAAVDDRTGRVSAELALKISDAAAKGRETFRGSKCVAGMLLANPEPVPLVEHVGARLLAASEATQRKAIAVLVNRFRINYLNSLATYRDAAYLADIAIEDLKSAQVMLFCRYLASRVAETHAEDLSTRTHTLFDQSLQAVPLGFCILMNADANSPLKLLDEAMLLRDRSFCRAAASETPQTRFLHQLTTDEFGDFQDHLFRTGWTRLLNQTERAELLRCRWKNLQIPSALAGIVGAVVGALLQGPLGAAAGGAAGSVVGSVTELLGVGLTQGILGNRRVHADQYRRLDRYFALAVKNDNLVQEFTAKVSAVFQRPLVIPS